MNSLDILITSPHCSYNECMGIRREKLYFDIGIEGPKDNLPRGSERVDFKIVWINLYIHLKSTKENRIMIKITQIKPNIPPAQRNDLISDVMAA